MLGQSQHARRVYCVWDGRVRKSIPLGVLDDLDRGFIHRLRRRVPASPFNRSFQVSLPYLKTSKHMQFSARKGKWGNVESYLFG